MNNHYLLMLCALFWSSQLLGQDCPPNGNSLEISVPSTTYCLGEEVPFSTNVTVENYSWNFGEGSIIENQSSQVSFLYTETGNYTVNLVVDHGNNCLDSTSIAIEIISSEADFTFTIDSTTVYFTADTSDGVDRYFWEFNDVLTGSGASVISTYTGSGASVISTFMDFGEYPVTLITYGVCGTDSITKTVIIQQNTSPEDNPNACRDEIDNDGDGDIDCMDIDCLCDNDNDGTLAVDDPDDNNPCVPDSSVGACPKDLDNDGVFSDEDPNDNDPCVPDNTVGACPKDLDNDGVLSDIDPDDNDPCVPDNTVGACPKDLDNDGVLSDIDPDDNDPCVPDNTVGVCPKDLDNDGVLSDIDPDDNDSCVPDNTVGACPKDLDNDGILSDIDPDDNDPCVPDNTVGACPKDLDSDGVLSDIDPDDNDPCVPDSTVGACPKDLDNDGVLSNVDPDDNDPCVPDANNENCPTTNSPQIFEDYPFLTDLVNPNNCTNEKITAYLSGGFVYIYIETATSGKLYLQTGQFYCQSGIGLDCVTAYGLSNVIAIWMCDNSGIVDNDNDGIYSDKDPDDANPCIPDDSVGACIQDKDEDGVFSDVDPDDNNPCVPDNTIGDCDTTILSNPQIFTDFPFLLDFVNPNNCTNEKISVYQLGAFKYIYVETASSGKLYLETGQFYCQSGIGFSCVDAYRLSNPIEVWVCNSPNIVDNDNDGTYSDTDPDDANPCVPDDSVGVCIQDKDEDGVFSDVDPDDNNPCVPDNTIGDCDTTIVSNPQIFTDFPFLLDLVDPNNCTNEKISIYQSGAFKYIYVETASSGKLYLQTSQFYCQSGIGFNCVDAYGLSNPIEVWVCNSPNIIDNDNDGIYSDTDPDDADPCVPDDSVGACIQDKDEDGVFSDIDPDDTNPCVPDNTISNCDTTVVSNPQIFTDFPFLLGLVDPNNCTTEKISVYQLGAFKYIYIETPSNGKLYLETGQFYCQSGIGFNCVDAYRLSDLVAEWTCGSTPPPPPPPAPDCNKNEGTIIFPICDNGVEFYMIETQEGLVYDIYFGEGIEFNYFEGQQVKYDFVDANFDSPCSVADKAITITCIEEIRDNTEEGPALFEEYTFLYTLVDPSNCSDEKVTVYASGIFRYLLVETPTGSALYFQDGSFYCTHTPTYNCAVAYGFDETDIVAEWSCEQVGSTIITPTAQNRVTETENELIIKEEFTFNAYPNPAFEQLWVNIESPITQNLQLLILNRNGQVIIHDKPTTQKGFNRIPIDLEQLNSGLYYLVIRDLGSGFSQTERISVIKK